MSFIIPSEARHPIEILDVDDNDNVHGHSGMLALAVFLCTSRLQKLV